jgi:ABC-type cobalt transport system substrate-binding protein
MILLVQEVVIVLVVVFVFEDMVSSGGARGTRCDVLQAVLCCYARTLSALYLVLPP